MNNQAQISIDREAGVIRGVSVISTGQARGHELTVDETTLRQVVSHASRRGKVPVKLNHGSGVDAICGHLVNFRIEGNQVRADWKLLQTHSQFATILETAQEQPETVGLSISFTEPEGKSGGVARVKELIGVDFVADPAANPTGLFSSRRSEVVSLSLVGSLGRLAKSSAIAKLLKNKKVRDRLAKIAKNPVARTAGAGAVAGGAGALADWGVDAQRREREEARRRRRRRDYGEEFSRGNRRVFECGNNKPIGSPGGRSILRTAGARTQSAQPLHLEAICEAATELSAVSGPVRRPGRARGGSSGPNQARNQAGQFQPGPASDPETMRKVYAAPKVKRGLATRLRAMRAANERIRKPSTH